MLLSLDMDTPTFKGTEHHPAMPYNQTQNYQNLITLGI